jgi:hypothetical protein
MNNHYFFDEGKYDKNMQNILKHLKARKLDITEWKKYIWEILEVYYFDTNHVSYLVEKHAPEAWHYELISFITLTSNLIRHRVVTHGKNYSN